MHGTSSELTRLVNHVNNVVLVLSIVFELFLSQLSIHYGTHMYPSAVISIVFVTACSQKLLSYLACGLVMSEASTLRVEPATGQRSRAVEEVRWMRWAQHQKEQVQIGKPWFGERSFLFCQDFTHPRTQEPKKSVKKHDTCCRPVDGVTPTHTHTKCVVAKSLESFWVIFCPATISAKLSLCTGSKTLFWQLSLWHLWLIYDWWTFRRKNLRLQSLCFPFSNAWEVGQACWSVAHLCPCS